MSEWSNSGRGKPRAGKTALSRELVELAALFLAVGAADLFANTLAHNRIGPVLLFGLGVLLIACAALHRWWKHRPERVTTDPVPGDRQSVRDAAGTGVWRIRTTVRDTPGSLAALTAGLAGGGIDIVSVQVHVVPDGAVDEFLVRAPLGVTADDLVTATAAGGGLDVHADRADVHDLVDVPTRVLTAAAEVVSTGTELPRVLRTLLGSCAMDWRPADEVGTPTGSPEGIEGTTMRLCDPEGGLLTLQRPALPFTPAEFARVRALLELDRRLAAQVASQRGVVLLPSGPELVIRPGVRADAPRVAAMHKRCSAQSRRRRYLCGGQPSVGTLERLLCRRHGHALLVEEPTGDVVAMANMRWDGEIAEIALLVQDSWQQRGIGTAVLRRLIAVAKAAGRQGVYAVTNADNEPMIRAMRTVGAQLDQAVAGTTYLTVSPLPGESVPGVVA